MVYVHFFLPWTAYLLVLLCVGLAVWLALRKGWAFIVAPSTSVEGFTDSATPRIRSSPGLADSFPVRPKCFNGDPRIFKEWCFFVELALESRNINDGRRQVQLASSLLEGNALLWLISCQEIGTSFNSWIDLRNALAKTLGPVQREEDVRLDFFSIHQMTSLEEYIQDFIRLSLSVTGLDDHSRAILFVKGLHPALQAEALREHPRTLSDALAAARLAHRQLKISGTPQQRPREDAFKSSHVHFRRPNAEATASWSRGRQLPPRTKLDDNLRRKLMQEGRCFKCRQPGHLSRDCSERNLPNGDRQ